MTGKRHADLMRDIRGYVEVLDNNPNANLHSDMFFIESTYFDTQNQICMSLLEELFSI